MKWCVLSNSEDNDHYQYVSAFLESVGHKNSYEFISVSPQTFPASLELGSANFDFTLVGNAYLDLVAALIPKNYIELETLNSIDGLLRDKDKSIWPTQFLDQALATWIAINCNDVGVTSPAFVVGSSGLARAVVAGLAKAGFTRVVIADTDTEKTSQMVEDLQKLFFNLDLQVCAKDQITLLPGVHSICVNTVSIFDDPALFQELFYCNFIKRGGVVLDLNRHPIETPLLKLSKGIAGKLFSGHSFWAFHDSEWIGKVFNYRLDVQSHSEELKKLFSKRVFDENKLSQILDL